MFNHDSSALSMRLQMKCWNLGFKYTGGATGWAKQMMDMEGPWHVMFKGRVVESQSLVPTGPCLHVAMSFILMNVHPGRRECFFFLYLDLGKFI